MSLRPAKRNSNYVVGHEACNPDGQIEPIPDDVDQLPLGNDIDIHVGIAAQERRAWLGRNRAPSFMAKREQNIRHLSRAACKLQHVQRPRPDDLAHRCGPGLPFRLGRNAVTERLIRSMTVATSIP